MWHYVLVPTVVTTLVMSLRHRKLLRRTGNIPVRLLPAGRKRWRRGHAVWVHDVFAFSPAPAAGTVSLLWVTDILQRAPTPEERKKLHRLGDDLVVGTLRLGNDASVDVATRGEHGSALLANPHGGPEPRDVIEA